MGLNKKSLDLGFHFIYGLNTKGQGIQNLEKKSIQYCLRVKIAYFQLLVNPVFCIARCCLCLKAEVFWFIFTVQTTIIKLDSQTESLSAVRKCIIAWPFQWNHQEREAELSEETFPLQPAFLPSTCSHTADKVSLQIASHPLALSLAPTVVMSFFLYTHRHWQNHMHCYGIFNICALCKHTLALPTSWKQQHSNSAINQPKAGNRGQEEEVEDRLWEKSWKKDGGGDIAG